MQRTKPSNSLTRTKPGSLTNRGVANPDFRYMDWAGLELIKNNKPIFKQEPHYIDIETIENFKIPEDWFLEKRIINSIHGVRHMMRSVIYAVNLSRYFGLNNVDRQALMVGSVLHDVRRMKDEGDSGHGLRSGQWLKNNLELVNHTFGTVLDDNYLLKVCQAIEFHEIPYAEMSTGQYTEYRKNRLLVDLLKTVDALDRYRLTWLNDWPKDKYMRAIPPDWIKHVAYNMVIRSEKVYLDKKDNRASIRELLQKNKTHNNRPAFARKYLQITTSRTRYQNSNGRSLSFTKLKTVP